MFIFFIPVFNCSHAYKPYKSHLALFIISNKSFTRSFSASNDYFAHRTTISYRNTEALYLKLFEIQCFPAFSISSCWYYYFTILHTLWEWLYLSKKKPAVYSRTTDFLYYSFYLLRCVSDKFSIFKHNLFYFLICLKSFVTNKAFKNIVFYLTAFPNFTPQNSSYAVVNPSRWQTGKYESVTSIHPRWQSQYFQPCFADKFVTEIAILHKKSGNETIFITAKNERLL